MCLRAVFSRIPRARLYIPTPLLLWALARLPFSKLRRGKQTHRLEIDLARTFGVRHVRTVSTCRIAFYLVLRSLGLRPGEEVLLTPLTIPDMINAVHTLGLKPVFVDLSPDAQGIDLQDLECRVSPRSRVLLVTHLSGLVPDMEAIARQAERHRLILVEDISQNWGARFHDRPLGTFGAAAVGSLSIGKTLASVGGGAILTQDERLYDSVCALCEQLLKKPNRSFLRGQILANLKFNLATHPLLFSLLTYPLIRFLCSRNPRMINLLQEGRRADPGSRPEDLPFESNPRILREQMPAEAFTEFCDLQGEVLLGVLKNHRAMNERRRMLAHHLYAQLETGIRRYLPFSCPEGPSHNVWWHFPLVVPGDRERFQMFLLHHGIDNGGYALALCSQEAAFSRYAAPTPGAQRIKEGTVFLPIHSSFSRRQMEQIAQVVNRYFHLYPPPERGTPEEASTDGKTPVLARR